MAARRAARRARPAPPDEPPITLEQRRSEAREIVGIAHRRSSSSRRPRSHFKPRETRCRTAGSLDPVRVGDLVVVELLEHPQADGLALVGGQPFEMLERLGVVELGELVLHPQRLDPELGERALLDHAAAPPVGEQVARDRVDEAGVLGAGRAADLRPRGDHARPRLRPQVRASSRVLTSRRNHESSGAPSSSNSSATSSAERPRRSRHFVGCGSTRAITCVQTNERRDCDRPHPFRRYTMRTCVRTDGRLHPSSTLRARGRRGRPRSARRRAAGARARDRPRAADRRDLGGRRGLRRPRGAAAGGGARPLSHAAPGRARTRRAWPTRGSAWWARWRGSAPLSSRTGRARPGSRSKGCGGCTAAPWRA